MNIVFRKSALAMLDRFEATPARDAFLKQYGVASKHQASTEAMLNIRLLAPRDIDVLYELAGKSGEKSVMQQITTYRSIVNDPDKARIARLPMIEEAVVQWLLKDRIDGWLYQNAGDGHHVAWVVTSVRYDLPSGHYGDKEPVVTIKLSANGASLVSDKGNEVAAVQTETIHITSKSLPNTIAEILGSRGFVHETAELRADYDRSLEAYRAIVARPNQQFICAPGKLIEAKSGYSRSIMTFTQSRRCVNDEDLVKRTFLDRADRRFWDDYVSTKAHERDEDSGAEKGGGPVTGLSLPVTDEAFTTTPMQPYHLIFDLGEHRRLWAHSSMLTAYEYKVDLRDKIVLPDDHRDIIEVLISDMGVLQEDVIEGKGGGTVILCEGDPGLGKTLLAEVYSEAESRILYKVNASQIGTTPEAVATNMAEIFCNALRWGAIVLLDEADVYVRVRGDDLEQTAIVAHLLQTMEYFNGIMIMTTNRRDSVDDAILSRCLAIIHFDKPTTKMAKQIWKILSEQLGVRIGDAVIDEMIEHYTYDDGGKARVRTAGRDIKSLIRLGGRYVAKRSVELDAKRLVSLGAFKGLS